jgi:hypothetical protein
MVKKFDLRSKLLDGLLAPLVLVLLSILLALIIQPVQILFGRPGLLVYTVVLIAAAVISLERCVVLRYPDTTRAWWGMLSGLLTWTVIETGNMISTNSIVSEVGVLSMMLVILIAGVLWKKVLPLGVKFFAVTLIGAWATHLGLVGFRFLVQVNSDLGASNAFTILGLSVAGLSVLILAWTFFQSKNRMQRLWVTLALWLCAMMIIYIFRGAIV